MRLFTTTIRGELGTETEVEISAGTGEGEQGQIGVLLRNVSRALPSGNESDLLRHGAGLDERADRQIVAAQPGQEHR